MQIVTASGTDVNFTPEEMERYGVHVVPLTVTLGGQSYREGIDIAPDAFYRMLDEADTLPVTSQPAVGEFATLYSRLAQRDPDILSIHISSGLSGTVNSALAGAAMTPEANVSVVDIKTLSAPSGWQVEVAARAAAAGWSREKILETLARISHLKGLIASVLNIKPLIGVEKARGTYVSLGQARSFNNAIKSVAEFVSSKVTKGTRLRAQVVHSANPEGAQQLVEAITSHFTVDWVPVRQLSLVLGAHVGRSMVGVCFAPADTFVGLP